MSSVDDAQPTQVGFDLIRAREKRPLEPRETRALVPANARAACRYVTGTDRGSGQTVCGRVTRAAPSCLTRVGRMCVPPRVRPRPASVRLGIEIDGPPFGGGGHHIPAAFRRGPQGFVMRLTFRICPINFHRGKDEMSENPLIPKPPRKLKGRAARKFWRRLAPIASQRGTLTPATEPLLAILCHRLAHLQRRADGSLVDVASDTHKLAKSLGLT